MVETPIPVSPAPAPAPARKPTASGTSIGQRLGSLGGRTLLTLLVLVVLTAAADRSRMLMDWSADRRFTLSPRLTSLLLAQQEPVELVGIWNSDDSERLAPITALATRMGSVTPKVTFRRLDPELQKPLVTAFRERFKEAQPGTLYVTRGTRAFTIELTPATRLVLQREVGGALVTLAEAELTPAYLLQGHGELRPEAGPQAEGANLLARSLALVGFEVSRLDASTSQPPAPHGVLVIAGPTGSIGERDLKMLTHHLQDGGGALIVADDRAPDDLVRWLRQHGLSLGAPPAQGDPAAADGNPGLITVSLRQHFVGQEAEFPHHNLLLDGMLLNPKQSVTQPLLAAGIPLLSPWTSPVFPLMPDLQSAGGQALAQRYRSLGTQPFLAEPLLRSVPGDSWAKPRAQALATPTDLALQPSLPLACAIEYQPAPDSVRANVGGRLVVWGSRQALSDAVLAQTNFANEQLLRRATTWLARRTAATDIPDAELAAFQINASDSGMFAILGLLVAVIPCLCLGLAMLTWWDRR
jgi:hypothetical protein